MARGHLINLETLFTNLNSPPIIANDYDVSTEAGKERFNNLLITEYDEDSLSIFPQCSCGHLRGRYLIGTRCDMCGDLVSETFMTNLESRVWLIPLDGVEAFITPVMWTILSDKMGLPNGFDTLKFLTDPMYRPPKPFIPDRVQYVLDQGHKRGLNYFINNFDEVMHCVIHNTGKNKIPKKLEGLDEFIEYNRDKVFTRYLPVPHRVMFPIEKSGKNSYGDTTMTRIINAIRVLQEGELKELSQRQKERRMVKCIELFARFHYDYVKGTLGGKNGALRQHLLGGRWHFTSRAVITSIYGPHDFKEVYYPWTVAVEQFKMLIINKLIKRGYTLAQVTDVMRIAAVNYVPIIATIFDELIEESPYIGLPIILQRNPTIRRSSAVLVYVTKVKPNTGDHTISVSMGNLTGMGADFDGDALNTCHIQDKVTHDRFETLSPDHNVMDLNVPWGISHNLKLQPPVVSTAANWILLGRQAAYGNK